MSYCEITVFCCLLLCLIISGYRVAIRAVVPINNFDIAHLLPVRGLMAILIIIVHVSYSFSANQWYYGFGSFGASIVSAFFFISGYGLIYSYKIKGSNYLKRFISKSLVKLLLPLILATIIFISISITRNQFKWGNVLGMFTNTPPLPYSWYIYALIILYSFFYIVFKFLDKYNLLIRILVIFGLTIIYGYLLRLLDFQVYWYLSLYGFNFGMLYAAFVSRINTFIRFRPVFSIILIGVVILGMALMGIRTIYLGILPFVIVLVVIICGSSDKSNGLRFLGCYSYEIYLAHGIVVPFVGILNIPWFWMCLICIISSIAIAVIIKYLSNSLLGINLNFIEDYSGTPKAK